MTQAKRRVYIKTYGCQMNVYDSARMADVLAPHGYTQTHVMRDADVILLNTCHIREKAAEKVYSELGRIRPVAQARKSRGKSCVIGVAGCVAQAQGEEMIARAPAIDMVIGPQLTHRLPELVRRAQAGERVVATDFPLEDKFDFLPRRNNPGAAGANPAAFVTVQEGCDKFCTFCVVPYTRGAENSRPVAAIAGEVRDLVAAGVREVMLLGQNVNAYCGADPAGRTADLATLVNHLANIAGLERLRYATSHPRDMTTSLIAAHRSNDKLMPYLHLPVQSGSDAVLKAMNRGHTADDYRRIVDAIRRARADMALSGDFIVGFPGETDADFAATLRLVEDVQYAQGYSFKYSPRPGTPAAALDGQVDDTVKTERLAQLQALLQEQQHAFNERMVGSVQSVLLERPGRKPGQLAGRTPYLQMMHLDAPTHMLGQIVAARVRAAGPHSLFGERPLPTNGEPFSHDGRPRHEGRTPHEVGV